jgi:hypothetical protein
MKTKIVALSLLLIVGLTSCSDFWSVVPTPTQTATVTQTPLPTETPTPAPTATPWYPPEGRGPTDFLAGVNPLTGLEVADPTRLERRPLAVKISNLPRNVRPQWGLSLADIVFEYYTEEGTTRFIALFYGNDADTVGPIRSARFIDVHVVRGYKAVFAFGSAWEKVLWRLFNAEFADRLVLEGPYAPLRRYDPNGYNYLVVDTAALSDFMAVKNVENGRQNLDGMSFRLEPPTGGQMVRSIFLRYSSAIYNRWDFDPATGKYQRYADVDNDYENGKNEQYLLQVDRLNGRTLAFDNVVVLFVKNEYYLMATANNTEVMDIQLVGNGTAYAFRDGQVYQVQWQRNATDVVSLLIMDGTPFPFKPGTTWFEVVGLRSEIEQTEQGWRFVNKMP